MQFASLNSTVAANVTINNNFETDCAWCNYGLANNVIVSNNYIQNFDHGLGMGIASAAQVGGPVYFFGNSETHATTWDTLSAGEYHHDGIHLWAYCANGGSYCPGSYWNNVYVYNNHFFGNWGTENTTAFIFFEENIHNAWIFNNLGDCSGDGTSGNECDTGEFYAEGTNVSVYNNTLYASVSQLSPLLIMGGPAIIAKNNVLSTSSGLLGIASGDESGNNATTVSALNNNIYMNVLSSNGWTFKGNFYSTWAAWAVGSGETSSSYYAGSTINTPAGTLQAGSPAIGAGANLYSLCTGQPNPGIGALCYDAEERPGRRVAHGTRERLPIPLVLRYRLLLA